jgi:hypothetical protein
MFRSKNTVKPYYSHILQKATFETKNLIKVMLRRIIEGKLPEFLKSLNQII